MRLGRILAELVPREPEVHGLVALMEIQASRLRARIGPSGEPVPLLEQDRARWDYLLVRRGLAALARAEKLGGAFGPYALQAAIAACHARARTPEETAPTLTLKGVPSPPWSRAASAKSSTWDQKVSATAIYASPTPRCTTPPERRGSGASTRSAPQPTPQMSPPRRPTWRSVRIHTLCREIGRAHV